MFGATKNKSKCTTDTILVDGKEYTYPLEIANEFESTAYLKFTKLQYVSSGFRCRVITGSLMRLY